MKKRRDRYPGEGGDGWVYDGVRWVRPGGKFRFNHQTYQSDVLIDMVGQQIGVRRDLLYDDQEYLGRVVIHKLGDAWKQIGHAYSINPPKD